MTIVRKFEELRNFILKLNLTSPKKIISVDGFPGAGNSMVGAYLNEILSLPVIYIDDFFTHDPRSLENFKFQSFSELIRKLHQNSSIIIDGALVEDVLARIKIKPDLLIYIKRTNEYGGWRDEFKLNKLLRTEEVPDASRFDPFQDQLIQYHLRVRPHEHAAVIFELGDVGS
ncbi:MAG TPA: hypothetical protein VMM58_04070 [Bacteroidota bacterium]|nr:hypothetical protein [Bacteroidota bacterium]